MRKSKLIDKLWKFIALIIFEAGVFFLGSWVVVRFFPGNEAIDNAIGILLIFAVGITVILYGNATKNRNLNVLGFAVFLFAIYFVIDRYEGFAVKISAFATLAVAIAAFAAIEENRHMRLEKREQEQEDRKERMLNEIQAWATKVLQNILMVSSFVGDLDDYKKRISDCRHESILSVAESIRMRAFCNSLSSNTQISASDGDRIKTSVKLMEEATNDFAKMVLDFKMDNVTEKTVENMVDGAAAVASRVGSLLEIVSEIAVA